MQHELNIEHWNPLNCNVMNKDIQIGRFSKISIKHKLYQTIPVFIYHINYISGK